MNRRRPVRVSDARERILAAARRLFAEQGIGNVSLRDVIRAAGVNPAALHYHFGSRLALLREVFHAARTPLNAQRRELLRDAGKGSGRPKSLRAVLHAFFWPVFDRLNQSRRAHAADLAFISQLRLDPSVDARAVLEEHERELDELFESALSRALPHLDRARVRLRMHLANSTAWDVVGQSDALEWTATGAKRSLSALYEQFLDFVVAGFLQDSTESTGAPRRPPGPARARPVRRRARLPQMEK
jgi:AcrR family transcriptional regulator